MGEGLQAAGSCCSKREPLHTGVLMPPSKLRWCAGDGQNSFNLSILCESPGLCLNKNGSHMMPTCFLWELLLAGGALLSGRNWLRCTVTVPGDSDIVTVLQQPGCQCCHICPVVMHGDFVIINQSKCGQPPCVCGEEVRSPVEAFQWWV